MNGLRQTNAVRSRMVIALAGASVILLATSDGNADPKAKPITQVSAPREQAELLAGKRKVALAASTKAKAAVKKELRAAATAAGRLRSSKKTEPAKDLAALDSARAAHARGEVHYEQVVKEIKALRSAEDELGKLLGTAEAASEAAQAQALAAKQAATAAQQAATAARKDAQRLKRLAALGNPDQRATKREREDDAVGALRAELDSTLEVLATIELPAAPPQPSSGSTSPLPDRLKAFKDCDIRKVQWKKVDAARWAKGGDAASTEAFKVLGYADTNRNGRPEAFLDLQMSGTDEDAVAAGGTGVFRVRQLEVYESDASCQLQILTTLDLGAPYDDWRVTIVADGVDVDGALYGQQHKWKNRWTKDGLVEVSDTK